MKGRFLHIFNWDLLDAPSPCLRLFRSFLGVRLGLIRLVMLCAGPRGRVRSARGLKGFSCREEYERQGVDLQVLWVDGEMILLMDVLRKVIVRRLKR